MASMEFRYCGHCDDYVSLKTFKEHRRLFLHREKWSDDNHPMSRSRSSSPLCLSDPPSPGICQNLAELERPGPGFQCETVEIDNGHSLESTPAGTLDVVTDSDKNHASTDEDQHETEYWQESESEIDAYLDIMSVPESPITQSAIRPEEEEAVLWIVLFTCVFQVLHKLPQRATEWLLKFIGKLLTFLGKFAMPIQKIAASFPNTLYLRDKYLDQKVSKPNITKYVVCSNCHALHTMPSTSRTVQNKVCDKCSTRQHLFKRVITGTQSERLYPRLLFPVCSLILSLQVLLAQPGFSELCEEWRIGHGTNPDLLDDVFSGNLWNQFLDENGQLFFSQHNTLGLMLNVDWFNPFTYNKYSCGVLFLSIMNLPRAIRYKRENIILLGLIPGPKEPSHTINSYLQPLVKELWLLWRGTEFETPQGSKRYKCALLCVACDTPAARKTAGFLGHSANLGCFKCYHTFGTGQFGQMNYAGFDRTLWKPRTEKQHRKDVKTIQLGRTKTERSQRESKYGCRYSSLLDLPYFDPVRMVIIDPMHNLYMGTAKRVFNFWVDNDILNKKAIDTINSRIASTCLPPGAKISRLPSTIGSSNFTAEQWMVWVNYYSISCLHQLLPSSHMECWRHFVLASRLISRYTITKEEVRIADALLLQFCRRFETLCGPQSITPNMHLHCHLHSCIEDFGPISAFWLFPYERFNGILGDEPINNHSIELQLINRFIEDNCYLRLLRSLSDSSVAEHFSPIVSAHAFQFDSVRITSSVTSGNQQMYATTSGITFIPPRKYMQDLLTSTEITVIHQLYLHLYPTLLHLSEQQVPSTFKKMTSITLSGRRITCGDYVLAKNGCIAVGNATIFSDPSLQPAKINHFVVHSIVSISTTVCHVFAAVSWPLRHPQRYSVGKPVEVWCFNIFDPELPCIIPVDSIRSSLCVVSYQLQSESVLLTVPL